MSEMVASAVAIVPDDSELDSNHNGLKRRQSDDLETEDSKRRRTSAGKITPKDPLASNTEPTTLPESPDHTTKPAQKNESSRDSRRRSAIPDDKQRSKRLFGALLGNLNAQQPNDRAAKRRADIEARRKAELAKQDNERLEDKQRRLRELAQHRKRVQISVDEQDMHTRHRNLLDIANMLQTEAEPRLYYRPWDLLPDEEARIEDQLAAVRTQIDEELADFEIEKKKRLEVLDGKGTDQQSSDREASQPVVTEALQDNSEEPKQAAHIDSADSESISKPADPSIDSANGDENPEVATQKEVQVDGVQEVETNRQATASEQNQEEAEDDVDGDHIVEGDEDNVIY